jgi:CheY-like chemotaxis protein
MSTTLIIDDHVDTCRMMQRLIACLGFRAVSVHSGREALTFVELFPPRLILLDLSMPEMDGFEVMQQLRAAPPRARRIPIVVVSAFNDDFTRRRAMDLGAIDYWVKSHFGLAQLKDLLEQHVPRKPPEAPLPPYSTAA